MPATLRNILAPKSIRLQNKSQIIKPNLGFFPSVVSLCLHFARYSQHQPLSPKISVSIPKVLPLLIPNRENKSPLIEIHSESVKGELAF